MKPTRQRSPCVCKPFSLRRRERAFGHGSIRRSAPRKHTIYTFTHSNECRAWHVTIAATFASRFIGLLRHRKLDWNEGMLLAPGGSVHTIGMRFPIDVLFLDAEMRILKTVEHVKPWRVAIAPRRTRFVLELPAGRYDEKAARA